ncbi:hypothetical protein [Neolewinella agarilytica]|uniref:hypothetical protein n=1 Tax=Neolewinella agarilytica TaxID=478744 RepID=UPI002357A4E7|nr:hypothetical protein [Neolewinella agarilytica]
MRFLLLLLFPIMMFSQQRIDTVQFEKGELYALRYISEMPADSAMSKSEMFMRGIRENDRVVASVWDRLDSIVVFNQAGERQKQDKDFWNRNTNTNSKPRPLENAPGPDFYLYQKNIYLTGRVGELTDHDIEIRNDADRQRFLRRVDDSEEIEFSSEEFRLPAKQKTAFQAETRLPPGSKSTMLEWEDEQGGNKLELTFVLLGYDLMEDDFLTDWDKAMENPWLVPAGREVLYLRLESTEKLMTIYREGRPFKKVTVGRQLDEVSLLALPKGDFMLEVIDLGTGKKRYHSIRR